MKSKKQFSMTMVLSLVLVMSTAVMAQSDDWKPVTGAENLASFMSGKTFEWEEQGGGKSKGEYRADGTGTLYSWGATFPRTWEVKGEDQICVSGDPSSQCYTLGQNSADPALYRVTDLATGIVTEIRVTDDDGRAVMTGAAPKEQAGQGGPAKPSASEMASELSNPNTALALHPPMVPNPAFEGKSGFGPFPDMLMELDHNVGRIIDAVEEAGIADNTLFILSGENGAFEGAPVTGQGFGTGNNGPWRGGLGTGYEGGFRSPAIIRCPAKIEAARVSNEIFAALDWMPTLAKIIGEEKRVPTDRPIDGIDQSDFLLGKQENSNREFHVMFIGNDLVAVKWRNFKMHFQTREGRVAPVVKWNVPLLYNIGADPGETRELNQTEEVGEYVWAATEALMYIGEITASMAEYRNIKPGEDFTGYEKKE